MNEGWLCPACLTVWAPFVKSCQCQATPGVMPQWLVTQSQKGATAQTEAAIGLHLPIQPSNLGAEGDER